jgi:ATP-dependent protease ClpP protease subunit
MLKINLLFLALLSSISSCSHKASLKNSAASDVQKSRGAVVSGGVMYLFLETEVDFVSAKAIIGGIKEANRTGLKTVFITIDSPGGNVGDGLEIIDAIEGSDAEIVCYVHRMAASMAAAILQSCDQRMMSKRATVMLHEPSTGMVGGKASEIQQQLDFMRVLGRMLLEQYALKSTMTADDLEKKISNYDWYLDWRDAKKYGFVDIITQ